MKEILYLIVGWILGLLGLPIASRIEKYYKRNDLKIAMFSELGNLAVRLAATYYKIQTHFGSRNKSSLRWVKSIYEKYRMDYPESVSKNLDKLLDIPDEQFDTATNFCEAPENTGLGLKTFQVPFMESVLENLFVFDSTFQMAILEIKTRINILNEEIEHAMFYFRLTFDPSCMSVNKESIGSNLDSSYANIQEQCKNITDKIDKVLSTR